MTTPSPSTDTPLETLKDQLDAYRSDFLARASEQRIDDYQRGVDELAAGGVLDRAVQVGDRAPDFELMNATGDCVRLSDVLRHGPVVLTWYRGGWCPYCNLTLRALQAHLPAFLAEGAALVALTPELPDKSPSTKEKNELAFEVLTDRDNEVARRYGLVYTLPPYVAEYFRNSFGLASYNGTDSDELPLAATYIIDREGVIRYAYLDADYRNRAEPEAVLDGLRAL